jgi:hypothetical protein
VAALALVLALPGRLPAQGAAPQVVTVASFPRAETDAAFAQAEQQGAFGKFHHFREMTPLDRQFVVRQNRDTYYSHGVFDLDAGPLTVTLPDAHKRFLSAQVVNQDHYVVIVEYAPATFTVTRQQAGTRYVAVLVRTLVNPGDPADVKAAHAAQDRIVATQPRPGRLEVQAWDQESLARIRDSLRQNGPAELDFKRAFGSRAEVDSATHLLGTARGWGGNPARDASYLMITPTRNDGRTVHLLSVPKDVPVDAFWSVTVYNQDGFLEPNPLNAYSLNSLIARRGADGSVKVQFGGCDGAVPNCLPIMPGWNYMIRLYRPRPQVLDGTWTFPDAKPRP